MSVSRRTFLETAALANAAALHAAGPNAAPPALPVESAAASTVRFLSARPVWPAGREREKNLFVGFRAEFDLPDGCAAVLRLTASSIYRAFLNGRFLGYGPARGPHGFYRVDEWNLEEHAKQGSNTITIEVAGYNVNSYYLLDQPAFLQAEVVCQGRTLASTAGAPGHAFVASILKDRVQRVQRYSFQRPFIEVYRLAPGDRYRERTECAAAGEKKLLPRRVPYPDFLLRAPLRHLAQGTVKTGVEPAKLWKDRSLVDIGPKLGGFKEEELELVPSIDLQKIVTGDVVWREAPAAPADILQLGPDTFHLLDFGTNLTGFLGARVTVAKPARLYLTFDEILTNQDVDFKRLGCVNALTFDLAPGTYEVESFEPYTLRYLKAIVTRGECRIERVYLREYANPAVWKAHFASSDAGLNRLFEAGRETFRQNAVDVFTDCPHRERAGWLCDSFFTARTAHDLAGDTLLENAFFENYLLPESFPHMPAGMLPMCYPADHNDGIFIPNWALFFVLQLEEYLRRSGDRDLVDALRPKVMRLFEYFQPFRNADGLLEKLESWVFIEWSDANKFVQDVNFPSNMLYAAALAAAGRMYSIPTLLAQADEVRNVIRRQSFDGEFFADNAVRSNGALQVTRNRTEVCQYFAFFFEVAAPRTHEALWRTLQQKFGPARREKKLYPEIHAANAFIGNVLRLELLSRYGYERQAIEESRAYWLYMAERTGTLWENIDLSASANHGFASHVVHMLYRDILGVASIDCVARLVRFRAPDSSQQWCEGRVPVPDGAVSVRWEKREGKIEYRVDVPAGYRVIVGNAGGVALKAV